MELSKGIKQNCCDACVTDLYSV